MRSKSGILFYFFSFVLESEGTQICSYAINNQRIVGEGTIITLRDFSRERTSNKRKPIAAF